MSNSLVVGSQEIRRYAIDEKYIDKSATYTIVTTDVHDSAGDNDLINSGFRFLDRILEFEIPLNNISLSEKAVSSGVTFVYDNVISDDIFSLAYEAYPYDRRFHLDPIFNQEKANAVIYEYIEKYKTKDIRVFKALHENELLGFTIVDESADDKKTFFENVLGATKPGIRGKMVAAPLYTWMLKEESVSYKKYYGKVSSMNVASINLHFQLGGHVSRICDEYIFIK